MPASSSMNMLKAGPMIMKKSFILAALTDW